MRVSGVLFEGEVVLLGSAIVHSILTELVEELRLKYL